MDETTADQPEQPVDAGPDGAEATPNEVQPDTGPGPEDQAGLLTLPDDMPAQAREWAEKWAQERNADIERHFQRHAEYRKGWEPFEPLNLTEVGADQLDGLLKWARTVSGEDDDAAREALVSIARARGIDLSDLLDDEFGDFEDDDELDPSDPDSLREELRSELMQELGPVQQFMQELAYRQEVDEHLSTYQKQLAAIEKEAGRKFSDDEIGLLAELAKPYADTDDDPLRRAWELQSRIAGGAQTELVKAKLSDPSASEAGGRAATEMDATDDWDEAKARAKARLAQAANL